MIYEWMGDFQNHMLSQWRQFAAERHYQFPDNILFEIWWPRAVNDKLFMPSKGDQKLWIDLLTVVEWIQNV